MQKLPITLACGLLVAIFFVLIQSPTKQQATAEDPRQQLSQLLERLTDNDEAMLNLISQHGTEMDAIEECHREESEAIKGKLVALQTQVETAEAQTANAAECECNCAAELADLKSRVEKLEAMAKPTVTAPQPTYPSVSSVNGNAGSNGGSTGTMVSGGSTGTNARPVQTSYGSTGSIVVSVASAPVAYQPPRTPIRNAAAVLTAPIARAGHWTYPGEIGNHLANDHGVSTAGMTREQQLDLHDALHEGSANAVQFRSPMVNVQTFSPARPPLFPRSYPVNSDCPDGNCPTGPQVQRVQSSGWFLGKNLGRR